MAASQRNQDTCNHSFTPSYIHPAFRLQAFWTRRLRTLEKPHSVQSALDFLVALEAAHEPRPRTLREFARRSSIPLSTSRRALGDLVELGWIIQDAEGFRIRLHQAAARTKTVHPTWPEKSLKNKALRPISTPPAFKEQIPEGDIPMEYQHGDTAPKAPRPPAPVKRAQKQEKPNLSAEERSSRDAVKAILEQAGASQDAVSKVLWNGRKVWSTWERVAKVVRAALDVADRRGGGIQDRGRFLVAAALRPNLGRSLEQSARKRTHGRKSAAPAPADPQGLLASWRELQLARPGKESPGFLDHWDRERAARRALVDHLAAELELADLEGGLKVRLAAAGLTPGSMVWNRTWEYHRSAEVLAQARIPEDLPAAKRSAHHE